MSHPNDVGNDWSPVVTEPPVAERWGIWCARKPGNEDFRGDSWLRSYSDGHDGILLFDSPQEAWTYAGTLLTKWWTFEVRPVPK